MRCEGLVSPVQQVINSSGELLKTYDYDASAT